MSAMSATAVLDPQFLVVTLAALWGAWVLLRPLLAWRSARKPTGACGKCSSASCTGEEPKLVSLGKGGKGLQGQQGLQGRRRD